MPPAVIGGAIAAGGAIASAVISKKGQDKATEAGLTSNEQALAYQKEQQQQARREWVQMWDNYNRRRAMLMDRYGLPRLQDTNPYHTPPGPTAQPRGTNLRELVIRPNAPVVVDQSWGARNA